MEKSKTNFTGVDEYIASFPKDVQKILKAVRKTIATAAPQAEEKISYCMPAFFFKGVLVYFAAFKKHIGFYPTRSGIIAFQKELSGYKSSKGAVQFPMDKPVPLDLIRKIVEFRVTENVKKSKSLKVTIGKKK